jgi:hypothetical protein
LYTVDKVTCHTRDASLISLYSSDNKFIYLRRTIFFSLTTVAVHDLYESACHLPTDFAKRDPPTIPWHKKPSRIITAHEGLDDQYYLQLIHRTPSCLKCEDFE